MLKEGDKAPDFTGIDQDGKAVSLEQFRGKKLILYFYPKDNTTGCTAEACSLRDGYAELKRNGFEIVGVSPDGEKSHRGFADKHGLQFTLIADTDKSIASAYGVWGQKKFMGREYMGILRTTFVIDGEGYIEKVFPKVNTKDHFRQIADSYGMKYSSGSLVPARVSVAVLRFPYFVGRIKAGAESVGTGRPFRIRKAGADRYRYRLAEWGTVFPGSFSLGRAVAGR